MSKEIQVGNEYEIKVAKLGTNGDGIVFIEGKVIIIKGYAAEVGEELTIKINKVLPKYAFAEVVE